MLDALGAVLLTAMAVVLVAVLVPRAGSQQASRPRLRWLLGTWFIVITILAALGAFTSPALPVGFAVGIAVLLPVLAGSAVVARTQGFGIPLATLVAVHVGRLLGVMFLILYSAGRLPYTFAHAAGWGDIATALLAIPVALAVHRQTPGWWWATAIWNVLGMLDLVTAVTLGVGSAPGSMLRFIFESPGSGAIVSLPLVLIPGFFVPLFLLTHVAVFAGLAAAARKRGDAARPAVLAPVR